MTADELLPSWQLARLLLAGGGVAPLSPDAMAGLLPDVWETPKAAKRWSEKAPFSLNRVLFKQLGAFKFALSEGTYRAPGQRRASRFLTWHEAPGAQAALERLVGAVTVSLPEVPKEAEVLPDDAVLSSEASSAPTISPFYVLMSGICVPTRVALAELTQGVG